MLETETYIDRIFLEAVHLNTFTSQDFFTKFISPDAVKEERYYHEKQVTEVLGFLERKSVITGQFKPEYTKNLGLLKEVRYGAISKFGLILARCPKFVRLGYYWVRIKQNALISLLGAFAFLKLCHNAYLGVLLAAGWVEYIYIFILLYVIALIIRKAIS